MIVHFLDHPPHTSGGLSSRIWGQDYLTSKTTVEAARKLYGPILRDQRQVGKSVQLLKSDTLYS